MTKTQAALVEQRIETAEQLFREGKSQKEIATALGVSKRTVFRYMQKIFGEDFTFFSYSQKRECEGCGGPPTKEDEGFLTVFQGKALCSKCLCPDCGPTDEHRALVNARLLSSALGGHCLVHQ